MTSALSICPVCPDPKSELIGDPEGQAMSSHDAGKTLVVCPDCGSSEDFYTEEREVIIASYYLDKLFIEDGKISQDLTCSYSGSRGNNTIEDSELLGFYCECGWRGSPNDLERATRSADLPY